MRIAGFLKARNEAVRDGNIYRVLANLEALCDGGILCDDASTDGTAEVLEAFVASHSGWQLLRIAAGEQDFGRELEVKQRMLDALAGLTFDWVLWLDADETWDAEGTKYLRAWLAGAAAAHPEWKGVRAHYTQLWRSACWARTDGGFDDGVFVKLWRWQPGLTFPAQSGTHRQQFPTQIAYGETGVAPFEIIHWGNAGKSLQWKAHQYAGGLGGVDRHLAFGHTQAESLATGVGFDQAKWSEPRPTYRAVDPASLPAIAAGEVRVLSAEPEPKPFSMDEIRRIRSMGAVRDLKGWFTVVVPTFNREKTLARAIGSLRAQRYEQWIAVVLDDGSSDNTPALMHMLEREDPRIFYCRYEANRGGVAMNELGMAMACEMTEWFVRLGSDDWFEPEKLAADAEALTRHEAVFAPFRVMRNGSPAEVCAGSWGPDKGASPSERLRRGEFLASWANMAARTDVLRRVRAHWGNFVDPRLRNCEDFLFNVRVAQLGVGWVWRPAAGAGGMPDGWWTCHEGTGAPASVSASADSVTTARDVALTRRLIVEQRP